MLVNKERQYSLHSDFIFEYTKDEIPYSLFEKRNNVSLNLRILNCALQIFQNKIDFI